MHVTVNSGTDFFQSRTNNPAIYGIPLPDNSLNDRSSPVLPYISLKTSLSFSLSLSLSLSLFLSLSLSPSSDEAPFASSVT